MSNFQQPTRERFGGKGREWKEIDSFIRVAKAGIVFAFDKKHILTFAKTAVHRARDCCTVG